MLTCMPTRPRTATDSLRPRYPMLRTGYAQFMTAIQPSGLVCSSSPNPVNQGSLFIPSCPGGPLSSPQAASNPHTSTAPAA